MGQSSCVPIAPALGHHDEHGDHDGQTDQGAGDKIDVSRSCCLASSHQFPSSKTAQNPVTQLRARRARHRG